MKRTRTGRVLATLFLGVIFGVYLHFHQMQWIGRGRDAFLAAQNHWFDKVAQYHSASTTLVAGVILAAIAVGLYELVAAGIANMLPPSSVEE